MRKIFALLLSSSVFAAIPPHTIPRAQTKHFHEEGVFEGGRNVRANLEAIRVSRHFPKDSNGGYERWVIEFSDEKGKTALVSPRFQLSYAPSERAFTSEGIEAQTKAARFTLLLRSIRQNKLSAEAIRALTRKSQFVSEIIQYPQIENGDMGLEIILRQDVRFEPHQPAQKEGRLVLDLTPTAASKLRSSFADDDSPQNRVVEQKRSPRMKIRPVGK